MLKERIKLKINAVQNPSTLNPSTSFSANIIMKALITSRKSPKENMVIGMVNIVKMGFTIAFKNAKTIATNIAD